MRTWGDYAQVWNNINEDVSIEIIQTSIKTIEIEVVLLNYQLITMPKTSVLTAM